MESKITITSADLGDELKVDIRKGAYNTLYSPLEFQLPFNGEYDELYIPNHPICQAIGRTLSPAWMTGWHLAHTFARTPFKSFSIRLNSFVVGNDKDYTDSFVDGFLKCLGIVYTSKHKYDISIFSNIETSHTIGKTDMKNSPPSHKDWINYMRINQHEWFPYVDLVLAICDPLRVRKDILLSEMIVLMQSIRKSSQLILRMPNVRDWTTCEFHILGLALFLFGHVELSVMPAFGGHRELYLICQEKHQGLPEKMLDMTLDVLGDSYILFSGIKAEKITKLVDTIHKAQSAPGLPVNLWIQENFDYLVAQPHDPESS
jgi:hypothetical protein